MKKKLLWILVLIFCISLVSAQTVVFNETFEQNDTANWVTFGTIDFFITVSNENAISGSVSGDIDTGSFANRGGIYHNFTTTHDSGIVNLTFTHRIDSSVGATNFNYMLSNETKDTETDQFGGGVGIGGLDDGSIRLIYNSGYQDTITTFSTGTTYNYTLIVNLDNNSVRALINNGAVADTGFISYTPNFEHLGLIRLFDLAGGDQLNGVFDNVLFLAPLNVSVNQEPVITLLNITNEPLFNASPVNYELKFFDLDSEEVNTTINFSIDGVLTEQLFKNYVSGLDQILFYDNFEINTTANWQTIGTVPIFQTSSHESISEVNSLIASTTTFTNLGGIIHNISNQNIVSGRYELEALIFQRNSATGSENINFCLSNNTLLNLEGSVCFALVDTPEVAVVVNNTYIGQQPFDVTDMTFTWNITLNVDMTNKTFNVSWNNPSNIGSSVVYGFGGIDQLKYIKISDVASGDQMNIVLDEVRLRLVGGSTINITDTDTFIGNLTPGENVTINVSVTDGINTTFAGFFAKVESNFTLNLSNITITPINPDNDDIINSSSILSSSNQDIDVNVSWFINNVSVKNDTFFFLLNGANITSGINCLTLGCNSGDNITVNYLAVNGFLNDFETITFNVSQAPLPPPTSFGNFSCIVQSQVCIDGKLKCLLAVNNVTGDPLSNAEAFDDNCKSLNTGSPVLIGLMLLFGLVLIGFGLRFRVAILGVIGSIVLFVLGISLAYLYPTFAMAFTMFSVAIGFIFAFKGMRG